MADLRALERFTSVDARVKQMILSLPDFRVGDQVHAVYVNKLKGSTPGRHTKFLGQGARYIDIFFPGWGPVPFTGEVSQLTGLGDGWWSDFAVAVLCQSMDNLTRDLRPQLKHDDIANAVNGANSALNNNSVQVYSRVFSATFSDFSVPFNSANRAQALVQYKDVLRAGVNLMDLWIAGNLWKNPDWQIFHHYIKLLALGASIAEVSAFNRELKGLGLAIPPTIDNDAWIRYTNYLQNSPQISHSDIDAAAADGITRSVYLAGARGGSWMKEENSFEFTANSQPGNRFRRAPGGGSCFSETTFVLMQDGSSRQISQIKPGEMVASPAGPRRVSYISTPLRGSRTLYSFNDLPFAFTGSHPFVNAGANGARFLSAEPSALAFWVPTHAVNGVGRLGPGALVASVRPGTTESITAPVQSIKPWLDGQELVYDVVLEPDSSGSFEYFAGSREQLFLVTSEVPSVGQFPLASAALGEAMLAAAPVFQRAAAKVDAAEREQRIQFLRRRISAELIYRAIRGVLPDTLRGSASGSPRPAQTVAAEVMQAVSAGTGYDPSLARLVETVIATSGYEVESAIRLGWRHFAERGGNTLAVSIADVLLENAVPLPPEARLQAGIALEVEGSPVDNRVVLDRAGTPATPFRRVFDQVVYFPAPPEDPAVPRRIAFKVSPLTGGSEWLAVAFLPAELQPPYRWLAPRLRDQEGTVIGHVMLDVRTLSAGEAQAERDESAAWNEEAEKRFAQSLGRRMSTVLTEMIDTSAGEFAAYAAASGGLA